jgi:hypothetical protein
MSRKQAAQLLALILLVTAPIVGGCGVHGGSGDAANTDKNGLKTDGGSMVVPLDTGSDMRQTEPRTADGGARLDGGTTAEVRQVDGRASADSKASVETAAAPDVVTADIRRDAVDVAAGDVPADAVPAVDIDMAPLEPCTEAQKFDGTTAVASDRTLTRACSPYTIAKSITISSDATLTIEAGVTLNMSIDTAIIVGSSTAGRLVVNGTADNPIVFTSPTQGAGDWIGIQFWGNTASGSRISYAKLDYCGQSSFACIHGEGGVRAGRVSIDHVSIGHVGDDANAIAERDTDSSFSVSNCVFEDISPTQYALSLDGASFASVDSSNRFDGSAIELRGGDIVTTATWKNPGTTIVVTGDIYLDGDPIPALTIAAGTQLEFMAGTGLQVGLGKGGILNLVGTAAAPIVLTSAIDPPNPGDWTGIILWYGSSAKLAHTTISYAGSTSASSSTGAVSVVSDDDTLDVQDSTISYSAGYGIGVPCGSQATIVNTRSNLATENAFGPIGPGPDQASAACQ